MCVRERRSRFGNRYNDMATGLDAPYGIALDVDGGKIYCTETSIDVIQQANLDKSKI